MVLILSDTDVMSLAEPALLMAAAEAGFVASVSGAAQVPLRTAMHLTSSDNRLVVMPGHLPDLGVLATKLITVCPGNALLRRPLVDGIVVVTNSVNGDVLAIIEAGSFTTLRTAAASAVATRVLARSNVEVLGVIGGGLLGRAHIRALSQIYDLREVRIFSRQMKTAEEAVRDLADLTSIDIRAFATGKEVVIGSDVVVTATTATNPVLPGVWLNEGMHVCAVGAVAPTKRELDTNVIRRASIIATDTRVGALVEAGDLVVPIEEGALIANRVIEVGDILLDPSKGRKFASDITLFKSVGTAALDVTLALALHRKAVELGVGIDVALLSSLR